MADDRHERIRQRAHAIWEREGRRDGEDERHWHQATSEIDAEDAAGAAPKPRRKAAAPRKPAAAPKSGAKPAKAAPAKVASAKTAKTAAKPAVAAKPRAGKAKAG